MSESVTTADTGRVASASERHPRGERNPHRITVRPVDWHARAYAGELVLADSTGCVVVQESGHPDRLYFPRDDVHWDRLTSSDTETSCKFKGAAEYFTVSAGRTADAITDAAWGYPVPVEGMDALASRVAFYHEKIRVVVVEQWPDGSIVETDFPIWGDVRTVLGMMAVEPSGRHRFAVPVGPETERDVVEGGQSLGAFLVAAAKTEPDKRIISATAHFMRPVSFVKETAIETRFVQRGKSFSTVAVDLAQDGDAKVTGLVLLDGGADPIIAHDAPMPAVPGPAESVPCDFGLTGREIRAVHGAYLADRDEVGDPEICAWIRYRDLPSSEALRLAMLVQPVTHWTIAASMRPHAGVGETLAHEDLSTGVMTTTINIHADYDPRKWHLYVNPSVYAGRGLVGGRGLIFSEDGNVVGSYLVHAMVRGRTIDPRRLDGGRENAFM